MYVLLSWVGARIFRTYAGVVRYSSSVDLLKVAYANILTLVLALGVSLLMRWQNIELLCALSPLATVATIVVSTMLMWLMRIVVKSLYDLTNTQSQKLRVLIYGALSGGVGMAKSIRAQNPVHQSVSADSPPRGS